MVLSAGTAALLRAAPRRTSLDGREALVVTESGDLLHHVGTRSRHLAAAADVVALGWVRPAFDGVRDALDGGPRGAVFIDTSARRYLFPLSTWSHETTIRSPAAMMRASGFTTLLEALSRSGAPPVIPPPDVHAALVRPTHDTVRRSLVVVSVASSRVLALIWATNSLTALSTALWMFTIFGLTPATLATGAPRDVLMVTGAALTVALSMNCALLGAWLSTARSRHHPLAARPPGGLRNGHLLRRPRGTGLSTPSPTRDNRRPRSSGEERGHQRSRERQGASATVLADMAFVYSLRIGMLTALASTALHTTLAAQVPATVSWAVTTYALMSLTTITLLRGVESRQLAASGRGSPPRRQSTST